MSQTPWTGSPRNVMAAIGSSPYVGFYRPDRVQHPELLISTQQQRVLPPGASEGVAVSNSLRPAQPVLAQNLVLNGEVWPKGVMRKERFHREKAEGEDWYEARARGCSVFPQKGVSADVGYYPQNPLEKKCFASPTLSMESSSRRLFREMCQVKGKFTRSASDVKISDLRERNRDEAFRREMDERYEKQMRLRPPSCAGLQARPAFGAGLGVSAWASVAGGLSDESMSFSCLSAPSSKLSQATAVSSRHKKPPRPASEPEFYIWRPQMMR